MCIIFSLASPGRVPSDSPFNSVIDLTNLMCWYLSGLVFNKSNASAILNKVLPVPAGPVQTVISPFFIACVNFFAFHFYV